MRCTVALAALLAGTALAKPVQHQKLHQKRDVVYQTEYAVVYEYVYVTETEGGSTPATAAAPASTTTTTTTTAAPLSTLVNGHNAGHRSKKTTTTSSIQKSTYSAPSSSAAPIATSTVEPSSAPVVATSTTSAAPSASPSGASSFQELVLLHHNIHRTNHSAPALVWNTTLAAIAYDEASVCVYAHNTSGGGGGYGQNIAAGVMQQDISSVITDMMYNGEVNWYAGMYGATNPSFTNFEHWGHFSQIVWKDTASVGCAVVDCTSGLANVGSDVAPYFTVCNYYPPGNMGGDYGTNVGDPIGMASVFANYGE